MGLTISNIRQVLDPCKQYMHCDGRHMVIAMGRLPKCIDLNRTESLISQVIAACNIIDPMPHIFHPEIDKDGTFECVTPLSNVVIGSAISYTAFAIGVMSRLVSGGYEAIYFYADGTIIVIDRWHNYKFHMDG